MKRRQFCVALLMSVVALAVMAPASDAVTRAAVGPASSVSHKARPTLNVGFGSASVVYGNFTPAWASNLFKKNGLNVNVVNWNTLGTGPAGLVAGQYDLLVTSPTQALAVAQQGKPISAVMNV